jgi:hypothetical protein
MGTSLPIPADFRSEQEEDLISKLRPNDKVPDTIAARIVGSTPETLRRWRHEKRHLRYYKVGSSVRYVVSDLLNYLSKNAVEPEVA